MFWKIWALKNYKKKISYIYGLEKSEEIEQLVAFLLEHLVNNLELLSQSTQVENKEKCNLFPLTCFPRLPIDFPENTAKPFYIYGDKVYYESLEDYGIVIGRFYAFDRASFQWRWKYLIIDNPDYTTDSCFFTCIYWETELEPLN